MGLISINTLPKTNEEIKKDANKLKSLGSPLTIEEIIVFLEKKESKKYKKLKRSNKSWSRREESEKTKTLSFSQMENNANDERALIMNRFNKNN
tara:strand:- start:175 stop:456 length:282 start_codon:yes stop_codon:yes gene_type:complete